MRKSSQFPRLTAWLESISLLPYDTGLHFAFREILCEEPRDIADWQRVLANVAELIQSIQGDEQMAHYVKAQVLAARYARKYVRAHLRRRLRMPCIRTPSLQDARSR